MNTQQPPDRRPPWRATDHDERGKFAPGNRGGGRLPRQVERQYLVALGQRWSPEDTIQLIEEAIELGREHKSPRLLLQAATLIMEYMVGKPIAKSVTVKAKWESLMYPGEDDGED